MGVNCYLEVFMKAKKSKTRQFIEEMKELRTRKPNPKFVEKFNKIVVRDEKWIGIDGTSE